MPINFDIYTDCVFGAKRSKVKVKVTARVCMHHLSNYCEQYVTGSVRQQTPSATNGGRSGGTRTATTWR